MSLFFSQCIITHCIILILQDSEHFFKEFYALFKNHPHIQRHLLTARNFAIGIPKKGSKLADLKDIKTWIADIVRYWHNSDQIKPVWAFFEHIMQEEKRQIICRKTVSDYNNELSREYQLNDEDITEMLLFMHRVGNILYSDEDILKETIILDVQWFVEAITSILEYRVGIADTDVYRCRFKTTGELTDQELTAIWKMDERGQTYLFKKKEVLLYMEHFELLATCDAQDGNLPLYYFPCMNKRRFKELSNLLQNSSSILCFQSNELKQLPLKIFYHLVANCLKIPGWSFLKENGQNCCYENVACFRYRHIVVVLCLCKFQIQVQIWSQNEHGIKEPDILRDIQRTVQEKLSEKMYPYTIGYKCRNGVINDEEDNSFIAQTEFPVANLLCANCGLKKIHLMNNDICWVYFIFYLFFYFIDIFDKYFILNLTCLCDDYLKQFYF